MDNATPPTSPTPAARCCSTSTRWAGTTSSANCCTCRPVRRRTSCRRRAGSRRRQHDLGVAAGTRSACRRRPTGRPSGSRACSRGWPRTPTGRAASCCSTSARPVRRHPTACSRRPPGGSPTDDGVRPRGGDLSTGSAGAAARRSGAVPARRRGRPAGGERCRQRRGLRRPGVHRARLTVVGPVRPGHDRRHHEGTTKAHLARAVVEAMAYQTRDVVEAMVAVGGMPITELRADGGASAMDAMLQFQADLRRVAVSRPVDQETTAPARRSRRPRRGCLSRPGDRPPVDLDATFTPGDERQASMPATATGCAPSSARCVASPKANHPPR